MPITIVKANPSRKRATARVKSTQRKAVKRRVRKTVARKNPGEVKSNVNARNLKIFKPFYIEAVLNNGKSKFYFSAYKRDEWKEKKKEASPIHVHSIAVDIAKDLIKDNIVPANAKGLRVVQ